VTLGATEVTWSCVLPLHPDGVCIDRKVMSQVRIPEQEWEIQKLVEFAVAPLSQCDAILGMPFLAEERILIEPAQGAVILPSSAEKKKDAVTKCWRKAECEGWHGVDGKRISFRLPKSHNEQ